MVAFAATAAVLACHALLLAANWLFGPMTLDEEIKAEAGAILACKP